MTDSMLALCLRALLLSCYALFVAVVAMVKVVQIDRQGTRGGREERQRNGGA
jgi:hypothetical protein